MNGISLSLKLQSQTDLDKHTNLVFKLIDYLIEADENLSNIIDLTNIFDLPDKKDSTAIFFDYANILSYAGNHYAIKMNKAIEDNKADELSEIQDILSQINAAQSFFLSQLS